MRLAIDSSPLEGAGRVEDTLNLLGHAGRDIARCVAKLLGESYESICEQSGATLLLEASVKKGLDLDWTKPGVRDHGLRKLTGQLDALVGWVKKRLPAEIGFVTVFCRFTTAGALVTAVQEFVAVRLVVDSRT